MPRQQYEYKIPCSLESLKNESFSEIGKFEIKMQDSSFLGMTRQKSAIGNQEIRNLNTRFLVPRNDKILNRKSKNSKLKYKIPRSSE
jgi:hypothetical protein